MVSFQPTEDEQVLCAAAHRFATERVRPALRVCEEACGVPESLARTYWQLGIGLMSHPVDLGGGGLGMRTVALVEEELSWGDPGVTAALPRPGLAGEVLVSMDDRTRERWIEPFTGQSPAFGSAGLCDSASRAVAARRIQGQVVLEGSVDDVPGADRAEWILVAMSEDGDLTMFAVPRTVAGVTFEPDSSPLGLRAARYGRLVFQGCALAAESALCRGEPALVALRQGLQRDLLVWAARAVGASRAALDYAVGYAMERHTFGRPIAEHQAVGFMIADMGISIDATRNLLWHAAWAFDTAAVDAARLILSAAQFAAETGSAVTTDAVQVLGGHGYVRDHPVEKWMRDARCIANVIGRESALLKSLWGHLS